MAECVIGNDYSVVYELQILPKGRFIIDNDVEWDFFLNYRGSLPNVNFGTGKIWISQNLHYANI